MKPSTRPAEVEDEHEKKEAGSRTSQTAMVTICACNEGCLDDEHNASGQYAHGHDDISWYPINIS